MTDALHQQGVCELGALLDARATSSVEITSALIARIGDHEALGAFLCVDEAHALAQARRQP